jgi:2-oxoglutarate ferredoxin oxidoreductase subunit beta
MSENASVEAQAADPLKTVADAMEHKGFSVVEVLINCHEIYGKRNGGMSAVDMFQWCRDNSVPVEESSRMSAATSQSST